MNTEWNLKYKVTAFPKFRKEKLGRYSIRQNIKKKTKKCQGRVYKNVLDL